MRAVFGGFRCHAIYPFSEIYLAVLEALWQIRIRDEERAETNEVCDNIGVAPVLHSIPSIRAPITSSASE